jgi:hypothetical protein
VLSGSTISRPGDSRLVEGVIHAPANPFTNTPPAATFPLVNQAHGLCLDAAAQTDTQNGGKIQLWQCWGGINQRWAWSGQEVVNQASGKCLDANWGTDANNGGLVQLWSCNSGPNQHWVKNGLELVNVAHGKCLDANWGTDANNGGLVQLWSCNNGPNQQWGGSASQHAYGPYQVIIGSGQSLYVRSGPGTGYAVVGSLSNNATFSTYCQASGTNINGNAWWDLLTTGGYISDYYTNTPGQGPPGSGIPAC